MTPPMTPREKVVFKQPCEHCQRMTTVDLTALASGSGDHAELARLAEEAGAPMSTKTIGMHLDATEKFQKAANPATVLALLAENAALTELYELTGRQCEGWKTRAAEAERKLAEAERLNDRAADLMRQCTDPERFVGASTLNVYANMRAWLSDLSKEAERG